MLSAGHLWLWLDQRMAHLCNEHAPQLAAHSPLIEQVSRLYMSDGQEVFAVTFQGNERDSLAASMELVCTFVERMAASAD